MANTAITIDVKKVNDAGETILRESKNMLDSLNRIKEIVAGTKSCFDSDGGDATRTNFRKSADKFVDFKNQVDQYGRFLQSYSGVQKQLNEEITKLARKIPPL